MAQFRSGEAMAPGTDQLSGTIGTGEFKQDIGSDEAVSSVGGFEGIIASRVALRLTDAGSKDASLQYQWKPIDRTGV